MKKRAMKSGLGPDWPRMIQEQGYAVGWSGGSIKSCPHADDSMRGAWIIGFGLGAEDREHRAAA